MSLFDSLGFKNNKLSRKSEDELLKEFKELLNSVDKSDNNMLFEISKVLVEKYNNPVARMQLAKFCFIDFEKLEIERDAEKAIEYISPLIDADDLNAIKYAVAICKATGDNRSFYSYAEKAALLGDPKCCDIMGDAYQNGNHFVILDKAKSKERYKTAADKGHKLAAFKYAYQCDEYSNEQFKYYKIAAEGEDGIPVVMNMVGGFYLEGLGDVEKNYEEAVKWFKKAADGGNEYGMYYYAKMHKTGIGCEKNIDLAKEYFKKSADKGHEKAAYEYAEMCDSESNEQFKYYKIAAEGKYGVPFAMNMAGRFYEEGWGDVEKNAEEAVKWYKKAADGGDKYGMYNYARMLKLGWGCEKDIALAKENYKKAADKGYKKSANEYAKMCDSESNEKFKYYKIAAEGILGIPYAMNMVGRFYYEGWGNVEKNYEEAVKWYRKAADGGNEYGMCNYADMLELGWGCKKNIDLAKEYYRKAADKRHKKAANSYAKMCDSESNEKFKYYKIAAEGKDGVPNAMNMVGRFYEEGWGDVEKNYEEAAKWYRRAADGENEYGMYNYARMLELGLGCEKDTALAKEYYKKAADKGDKDGALKYAKMCDSKSNEQFKYYKIAAECKDGVPNAMNMVGRFYEEGWGDVEKNAEEAVKWYKKAAQAGDVWAQDKLKNESVIRKRPENPKKNEGEKKNYHETMLKTEISGRKDVSSPKEYSNKLTENKKISSNTGKDRNDNMQNIINDTSGVLKSPNNKSKSPSDISSNAGVEIKKDNNLGFFYSPGEYAYAKCAEINDNYYIFHCIDGYSNFVLKKDFAKRLNRSFSVDDGIWVLLKEPTRQKDFSCSYKVYIPTRNNNDLRKEASSFAEKHKIGEMIKAPIDEISNKYIQVRITPNYTVRIYRKISKTENYKVGQILPLFIENIINENGSVRISCNIISEKLENDIMMWNKLPKSLSKDEVIFYGKGSKLYDSFVEHGEEKGYFEAFNIKDPKRGISFYEIFKDIYEREYKAKRITFHQTPKNYYMEFDTGKRANGKIPIHVCFKKDKKGFDKWICNLIGFSSAENDFEKYVYIDNWPSLLNSLSDMALKGEHWDLAGEEEKGKKFILKQYLRFTFYKVKLERLLVSDVENKHGVIFNTGLVNKSYDPIYCFLKNREDKYDFFERKWQFGFFACVGSSRNGKLLNEWFKEFPDPPKYIKKIEDVFFDVKKDLNVDYDHIIEDNLSRLPIDFLIAKLSYNDDLRRKLEQYKANPRNIKLFNEIKKSIAANENMEFTNLAGALKLAVNVAKKYCSWNYKTAIPIYYPRSNKLSLLLPICLTNNDNKADVALVISKRKSENYQGETILTLDMAYQDARLICRPNSEWLTHDSLVHNEDIENMEKDMD